MKKMIYSLLFVLAASLTFSACTEEEIKPTEVELSNGGSSSDTGAIKR